jgi:integrase/recombinase XerD
MSKAGPQPRRVKIIRYVNAAGRRVRKGAPGARRVVEESAAYYATLKIDGRKQRVPLGTADLGQAWRELRRLQRRAAEGATGRRDAYTDHAVAPLGAHVDAWLTAVADKGVLAEQVQTLRARLRRLAGLAGWERLGDVSAESCLRGLAQLQTGLGRSAQTRNHYLTHAKQFLSWCQQTKRARANPLAGLKPLNVKTDRRHDRRAPDDEEIKALMAALEKPDAPVRRGMTGPQRALGYRVCMATGFRAKELRRLTRASFDLDAGTVTCRAAYSKRRRTDTQHLPAWLVAELRAWFDAGGGLWEAFPAQFPGQVLQADLALAGIPYAVEGPDGPLYFDFHALRHWFCTWAANLPGISPKTLLTLTRHSTLELTLTRYAKKRVQDVAAAVQQVPDPAGPGKKDQGTAPGGTG